MKRTIKCVKHLISWFVLGLLSSAAADPNLVAQYNFEGNVQDSTANAYHGTVGLGAIEYIAGVTGNGASFDADRVVLPLGTVSGIDKEITIMYWQLSPSVTAGSSYAVFLAHDLTGGVRPDGTSNNIYYWRIDEINDPLNPASCTGDVWEFTTGINWLPVTGATQAELPGLVDNLLRKCKKSN